MQISVSGGSAEANLRVLGEDLPVINFRGARITFPEGRVSLSYTIVTEGFEFMFRALVAVDAFRQFQGGRIRDDALDSTQPRVRSLIDAEVRRHLDPMVRQLILDNRRVMPGIDLASVLLGQQENDDDLVDVEIEEVTPQEAEGLRRRGINLP
jgi:hypothetical protein